MKTLVSGTSLLISKVPVEDAEGAEDAERGGSGVGFTAGGSAAAVDLVGAGAGGAGGLGGSAATFAGSGAFAGCSQNHPIPAASITIAPAPTITPTRLSTRSPS